MAQAKIRKVPLRRCVVCRRQGVKEGFIRAALMKDGKAILDESGKAQGRGAYVCKTAECVNKLIKQRGFNRSFKREAGAGVYEEAAALIGGLPSFKEAAEGPLPDKPLRREVKDKRRGKQDPDGNERSKR